MTGPRLPTARGGLSATILSALCDGPPRPRLPDAPDPPDPYGDDVQLALYLLYELHYQGFQGVDDEREWDPDLLAFRRALESCFLAALRSDVPPRTDAEQALAELLVEPVGHDDTSVSHHLQRDEGRGPPDSPGGGMPSSSPQRTSRSTHVAEARSELARLSADVPAARNSVLQTIYETPSRS